MKHNKVKTLDLDEQIEFMKALLLTCGEPAKYKFSSIILSLEKLKLCEPIINEKS